MLTHPSSRPAQAAPSGCLRRMWCSGTSNLSLLVWPVNKIYHVVITDIFSQTLTDTYRHSASQQAAINNRLNQIDWKRQTFFSCFGKVFSIYSFIHTKSNISPLKVNNAQRVSCLDRGLRSESASCLYYNSYTLIYVRHVCPFFKMYSRWRKFCFCFKCSGSGPTMDPLYIYIYIYRGA